MSFYLIPCLNLIIDYFSLKFNKFPLTTSDVVAGFVEHGANFLLTPISAKFILTTLQILKKEKISFKKSDCVDYIDLGSFATRINPASVPMFQFVRSFDSNVWSLILISIIVLSFISSLIHQNFHQFFEHIRNFTLVLYAKSLQNFLKHFKSKIILGVWLMAALYLATIFTGFILDNTVKAVPLRKIDSLEQLAGDLQVKVIYTRSDSYFRMLIELDESEIGSTLRPRLKNSDELYRLTGEIRSRLRNGEAAIESKRLNLIFLLLFLSQSEKIDQDQKRLVDIVHIAKHRSGNEPYFLGMTMNVETWIINAFNEMQDQIFVLCLL